MLPKVASHLLHHTSRAVAAVQSQTGHTIRNVLQSCPSSAGNLCSWNCPSSSNSNFMSTWSVTVCSNFSSISLYHSGYTVSFNHLPSSIHMFYFHLTTINLINSSLTEQWACSKPRRSYCCQQRNNRLFRRGNRSSYLPFHPVYHSF